MAVMALIDYRRLEPVAMGIHALVILSLLAVFAGPTECRVRRIVAAGDTVVVEWHGRTPTRDRGLYAQDYCWIIRVSDDCRTIREITGYFDTDRVNKLLAPSGPLAVGPASR